MNASRMPSSIALVACAASAALMLVGCGSRSDDAATRASNLSEVFSPPARAAADNCPMVEPGGDGAPDWTLPGSAGSVAVTGSTDKVAPSVKVQAPFKVTETQVHTLQPGDGPVVGQTATVSVCYMGVNGRDGNVFDSSYQRGQPVEFALNQVVPGFQKAIAGQKVGSTVAVAMIPADGYPQGQPRAGIQPGDTLIFAIKILNATS